MQLWGVGPNTAEELIRRHHIFSLDALLAQPPARLGVLLRHKYAVAALPYARDLCMAIPREEVCPNVQEG